MMNSSRRALPRLLLRRLHHDEAMMSTTTTSLLKGCSSSSSCCCWAGAREGAAGASGALLGVAAGAAASSGPRRTLSSDAGSRRQIIFDKDVKAAQRERAKWGSGPGAKLDPLVEEVTARLLDRLDDCTKKFPVAVVLGGAGDVVARHLADGRAGIEKLYHIDSSAAVLEHAKETARGLPGMPETEYIVADDEGPLPFDDGSVDVIISSMGLHWVNDLPGVMVHCRRALRADGFFLGAFLGGQTLQEMRIACAIAEMERLGGVSPRMSPLAQIGDAGSLLGVGGFALPSVDTDEFEVAYEDVLDLVAHLRRMGEGNAVVHRQPLKRDTALAAAAIYHTMSGAEDAAEGGPGGIMATYQVVYMAGWSPHPSQQQPAKRGSATASIGDLPPGELPGQLHDAEEVLRRAEDSGGGVLEALNLPGSNGSSAKGEPITASPPPQGTGGGGEKK